MDRIKGIFRIKNFNLKRRIILNILLILCILLFFLFDGKDIPYPYKELTAES
jgi:hypothetical protein